MVSTVQSPEKALAVLRRLEATASICSASSTTCSTYPRSKPANSLSTLPTTPSGHRADGLQRGRTAGGGQEADLQGRGGAQSAARAAVTSAA